jgi:hypothetical protein
MMVEMCWTRREKIMMMIDDEHDEDTPKFLHGSAG